MKNKTIILGAGITGLSAGISTESQIYEASDITGGICASYYVGLDGKKSYFRRDEESYRFEIGGGHWIFGKDKMSLNFINELVSTKTYERSSAVYFSDLDLYVPYPLQNNLFYLPEDIRGKALEDILSKKDKSISTLADWLEVNFGKILCELFFFPFHELYTAGLYTKIAPQDKFKTPVSKDLILKGAKGETPAVGYNATFIYPRNGLDVLIRKMTEKCKVNFNKRVTEINLDKKEMVFSDGSGVRYETVVSTLPMNKMLELTGLRNGTPNPHTSVLVVNIGAKKGNKCPPEHWIYIPKSKAGFHRVGFYSNVDNSFLPLSSRHESDRVSIYVEKAYSSGMALSEEKIQQTCEDIVNELLEWEFISEAEAVDPTWIENAYTWQYPDSNWVEKTITDLQKHNIYQTGRYGKWKFQGITESIKDGIEIGKVING